MTSNAPIISVLHVGQAAMAKQGAVILPPLLENLPTKRSKEYYEWFCLGMGEGTESSEDNSSAESEALAPRKKMKLSVRKEKDKENRWQFVDETKEQALGTKFVQRTPLLALNGPCQTLYLGATAETLDFAMNPTSKSR